MNFFGSKMSCTENDVCLAMGVEVMVGEPYFDEAGDRAVEMSGVNWSSLSEYASSSSDRWTDRSQSDFDLDMVILSLFF